MTKIFIVTNSAQNCHNITDHKDLHISADVSLFCSENSGLHSLRWIFTCAFISYTYKITLI